MSKINTMKTIWENKIKKFDKLNQNISCDTLIIGGGIAGIWCAYKLTKAGQKVCVLEANRIGSGVTAGSSSILTFAQELLYNTLINKHGTDTAKQYLSDTQKAIKEIVQVVKEEKINCDLQETNFVLYSTKLCGAKKIVKEKKAFETLELNLDFVSLTELPHQSKKALLAKGSFLLDPLKLMAGLVDYLVKNGAQIFEQTFVTSQPDGKILKIDNNTIHAKNFIVATHYPFINFPGFYFLKLYQSQNYTIVFKPPQKQESFALNTTYECIDKNGFEYRRVGKNILCLGPDVRTGKKTYHSKYRIIEEHLKEDFSEYKEITRFSAQDCITADQLPYAGLYSNFLNNVYVLTGFNKWGITNSYITSSVVCNMITKKISGTKNIYAPDRNNFFASIIQTVKNLGVDIAGWGENLISFDNKKIARIKKGQGATVKIKGKRVGIYRDENNKLHCVSATCTHLGCALKWNKDETSFDCPCHGSRFNTSGKVLNNPAFENLKKIDLEN